MLTDNPELMLCITKNSLLKRQSYIILTYRYCTFKFRKNFREKKIQLFIFVVAKGLNNEPANWFLHFISSEENLKNCNFVVLLKKNLLIELKDPPPPLGMPFKNPPTSVSLYKNTRSAPLRSLLLKLIYS